jgi:hypothetical protein
MFHQRKRSLSSSSRIAESRRRNSQISERQHQLCEETETDAAKWDYFLNIAQTQMRMNKNSLGPIVATAEQWGIEKVHHYQWASMGERYCNMLKIAASRNPVWEEAVTKLNRLLLVRLSEGRSLRPSPNPLHLLDLQHLAAWTSLSTFCKRGRRVRNLEFEAVEECDIPAGFEMDQYGLLIHAQTPYRPKMARLKDSETYWSNTLIASCLLQAVLFLCSVLLIAMYCVRMLAE